MPTADGKLRPADVEPLLSVRGIEHHAQPRVVSVSQVAETGTVYTPAEIRALADLAHSEGMYLHMDGARVSNAAASLGRPMREFTTDAGVDVLSFGGAKNGLLFGEAVCFLAGGLGERFVFERKSAAQLASKMRYIGAQFEALFGSGLWRDLAAHANAMAARLADGAKRAGVELAYEPQANEVFPILPARAATALRESTGAYDWEGRADGSVVVRWVASWDTTEADVDALMGALPAALA